MAYLARNFLPSKLCTCPAQSAQQPACLRQVGEQEVCQAFVGSRNVAGTSGRHDTYQVQHAAQQLPAVHTSCVLECVSCCADHAALVMDFGPNPWVDLRKSAGLPHAASGCLLTNVLSRLRGQKVQRCWAMLEVFLSTFLIEPPRPLAAHQVGACVLP